MKILGSIVFIAVIFTISSLSLNAQDRNEVIAAYNEGAKAMQTDIPGAIAAFEKVIVLSDKVGETANDLKQKAVQVSVRSATYFADGRIRLPSPAKNQC